MRETIADKILNLMRDNFGTRFTFYYGDPLFIPQQSLPALMVQKRRTTVQPGATGMEVLQHTISVKVSYNVKDDYLKNGGEVPGQRSLEELTEGIDENTGEFAAQSIAGILQRNFTLGDSATDQTLDISYEPGMRDTNTFTTEAEVTCSIEELLTLTGRS